MSRKHETGEGFFINTGLMFLLIQVLGLYIGFVRFGLGQVASPETGSAVVSFLVPFIVSTVVLLLLLKFLRGGFLFKGMLAFIIFMGSWVAFSTFVPDFVAIPISLLIVAIRFLKPTVFSQNVSMVLALSGVGATLGLMLPIAPVLILLAILSVYDVLAVYHTKHMVSLFDGLLKRGVPFSLVIPQSASHINETLENAQPGEGRFIMLGTGDVAFPLILAVSALRYSMVSSVAAIIGALIGLFFVNLILMQKKSGAIPALPPIMFFSIIGFVVSIVL